MNKRKIISVGVLTVLFTIMQTVGYQISMYYGTTVHQSAFFQRLGVLNAGQLILAVPSAAIIWFLALYGLFSMAEKVHIKSFEAGSKKKLVVWACAGALLFVSWIPCFLAAYPGFYNYDAMDQVPQALYEEVPYSAHHPLLHTLLMGKIIALGYHAGTDLNDGIALYSICQMLICAAAFGYIVSYIFKITGKYLAAAAAFCYYAFFPIIAMFTVCTTKDVLFAVFLQLCIIMLYEMCKDMHSFYKDKRRVLSFAVFAVLMCLLRKNGIYIVAGSLPFVVLLFKKYRRQCVLLFGIIIAAYFLIDKSLIWALEAEKGSAEEALSVPIQQIARVYNVYGEEAFEEEELALIYQGISEEDLLQYNPFLSDHVKNIFDFNVVLEHKGSFLLMWLQKGLQYPGDYIRAFLDNTYQAWYPGTSIYDEPGDGATYYFAMNMCAGGYRDSKLPGLLEFYEKIATDYYYQKLPLVRLFFSIGTMFWVVLFALVYGIYQKNKALILAMLMALLCCGTVFLGPVSLVRYYLVLFYGFPVTIALLSQNYHCISNRFQL